MDSRLECIQEEFSRDVSTAIDRFFSGRDGFEIEKLELYNLVLSQFNERMNEIEERLKSNYRRNNNYNNQNSMNLPNIQNILNAQQMLNQIQAVTNSISLINQTYFNNPYRFQPSPPPFFQPPQPSFQPQFQSQPFFQPQPQFQNPLQFQTQPSLQPQPQNQQQYNPLFGYPTINESHHNKKESNKHSENKKDKDKSHKKHDKSKSVKYEGDRLNGIIRYLGGGDAMRVINEGIIDIKSSSAINSINWDTKNVFDFNDSKKGFHSRNEPNSWICYDFKENKVKLSHYSLQSHGHGGRSNNHLFTWCIEGSDDMNDWEMLDTRNAEESVARSNCTNTFQINKSKQNKYYRYIRLRQTGVNTCNNNSLVFSALEFFGKILKSNEHSK